MRCPSRNWYSWIRTKAAGSPPSEGTSGVVEVPFSPWQARHGASRSANGSAAPGRAAPRTKADTDARAIPTAGPWTSRRCRSFAGLPAIAHTVDRAVEIIGHEQRTVLHHLHVDGP